MSRKKLERQLNLAICLMATTRYLSVDEIADLVPGYTRDGTADGEAAFRRMFERDKAELRELGIPVETGGATGWDDEIGYRIQRSDYALPDLHLTPDEAAALGLAARLWSSAALAEPSASAMRKLRAAGIDPLPPPAGLEPRVGGHRSRVRARAWRPSGSGRAAQLRLPPARSAEGVATRRCIRGASCPGAAAGTSSGHDLDRGESRVFRLVADGAGRARRRSGGRGDGPAGCRPARRGRGSPTRGSRRRSAVVAAATRCGAGAAAGQRQPGPSPDTVVLTDRDSGGIADRVVELGADAQPVDSPELAAELRRRLHGSARRASAVGRRVA